jgi:hypothetical protein
MSAVLNRRVSALEQASKPREWPRMIVIADMAQAGTDRGDARASFALVLTGSTWVEVTREDGEPLEALLSRVEARQAGASPTG